MVQQQPRNHQACQELETAEKVSLSTRSQFYITMDLMVQNRHFQINIQLPTLTSQRISGRNALWSNKKKIKL